MGESYPEMILEDAIVERYENSSLSIKVNARVLEIYDKDRMWAGSDVAFTQLAGNGEIDSEGSAGLLLIDNNSEVYTLGNGSRFTLVADGMTLSAPDLRWVRKTQQLYGTVDGEVEITKEDGSVMRGTGFYADTLSRAFALEGGVSGSMVSGGDKPESVSVPGQENVPNSGPDTGPDTGPEQPLAAQVAEKADQVSGLPAGAGE